ncbi:MAG: hypothetical protein M0R70_15650, partial [Nitrospirae bacterium]|nr:hypothetical protein [Nitrospirota bacterium]
ESSLEKVSETKTKKPGTANHCSLKPDISILVTIGHFYFGLTLPRFGVDKYALFCYICAGLGTEGSEVKR